MTAVVNTDPPKLRCGMCGGRCRHWKRGWIECRGSCCWSSYNPRRIGLWWHVRVWLGR